MSVVQRSVGDGRVEIGVTFHFPRRKSTPQFDLDSQRHGIKSVENEVDVHVRLTAAMGEDAGVRTDSRV